MKDQKTIDVYTENIINRIDKEVRSSLTKKQIDAVKEAIQSRKPFEEHGLDVRGIIPLFISRYYFVFLMGRDRSSAAKRVESERKRVSSIVHRAYFLAVMLSPVLLFLFLFLYILKSLVG